MKLTKLINSKVLALTLGLTAFSMAGMISTAPASFGTATHKNPNWQMLGPNNSPVNNGVVWSLDNGLTWGNTSHIQVGQTVKFKIEVRKHLWGTHAYDQLGVWIDTDLNGNFSGNLVYQDRWNFKAELNAQVPAHWNITYTDTPNQWYWNPTQNRTMSRHTADSSRYFTFDQTFNNAGTTWFRSRVVCNFDLEDQARNNPLLGTQIQATGNYYQGEVEDYKFIVEETIPEPSTLGLLGLGLISLAAFYRRRRS